MWFSSVNNCITFFCLLFVQLAFRLADFQQKVKQKAWQSNLYVNFIDNIADIYICKGMYARERERDSVFCR